MAGPDLEAFAWEVSRKSRLDDRPWCDPRALAVCYLGLRLCPRPNALPRLSAGRIIYPADASEAFACYAISHEIGHYLLDELECCCVRESIAAEERAASRIGTALLLPREPYLRDLADVGHDIRQLCEMWPLASPWIHARRIAEVTGEVIASRWTPHACIDRVGVDGVTLPPRATSTARELAQQAFLAGSANAGPAGKAWLIGDEAIVVVRHDAA